MTQLSVNDYEPRAEVAAVAFAYLRGQLVPTQHKDQPDLEKLWTAFEIIYELANYVDPKRPPLLTTLSGTGTPSQVVFGICSTSSTHQRELATLLPGWLPRWSIEVWT